MSLAYVVFSRLSSFCVKSDKMANKKRNGIPDRWLDYTPIGQRIQGTNIIAFKVPLKTGICERRLDSDSEWFTPAILLRSQPQIKAVIDLTNTNKYYDPEEFRSEGIDHFKIMAAGRGEIPPPFKIREFFDAVEFSLSKHAESPDALIGVHCTHGLNRTGYFVCRWMVDRMKMTPDEAISRFEEARGHRIERDSYINNIKSKNPQMTSPKSRRLEYSSPLADPYEEDKPSRNYRQHHPYNRRPDRYNRQPCKSDSDTNWRSRDEISTSSRDNMFRRNDSYRRNDSSGPNRSRDSRGSKNHGSTGENNSR